MESQIQPFTVIEQWKFEAITPGQFITFTMQNPLNHRQLLPALVLRFAVLDSPIAKADDESPVIAALVVPKGRESDWIFSSESGQLQLLFKSDNVSRLILIGNNPPAKPGLAVYKRPPVTDTIELEMLENELKPLLMSMHPEVGFNRGLPETLFLTYEDDVAYRVTVAELTGPIVGEFLVEDVELVGNTDRNKQLRRRLRFKRAPNIVQSQALLHPIIPYDEGTTQTDLESLRKIENATFEANTELLVHHYLNAMVAGLYLIASHLNERIIRGITPRALCLGIGGGVLLSFLNNQMWFEVTGVESDQMVLNAATKYFGLDNSGFIRLIVGDAIEVIQNFPRQKTEGDATDELEVDKDVQNAKFDMVFVDMDSIEVSKRFSAPPSEFVKKPVFECLRSILDDHGAVIMHVVPFNEVFYATLVKEVKETFQKVYGIDVGNQDNCFVMATAVSKDSSNDDDNEFLKYLKSLIPETFMDSIVKL